VEPLDDHPGAARERAFVDARRLAQAQRLDDAEVEERLGRALARERWAELAPALSIEGGRPAAALEARALGDEERAGILRRLAAEGWFRAAPFLDGAAVATMRAAVEALVARGWPPVFAYVYDEFWAVLRTPSMARLLRAALGAGYRLSPRVWAFCIPAEKGASGWPPHVDGGAGTHTPDRITLWIPLGDATLENGCIYLVPKDLVPARTADDFADAVGALDHATWRTLLQGARALPAAAGSVLGWDFQVIHWSSLAGDAEAPRVSLAVEAFGEGITPTASELPLLDPEVLPPFEERLGAIARSLISYDRFEPAMLRYRALGWRILDAVELG
jgi:hypothetical protein